MQQQWAFTKNLQKHPTFHICSSTKATHNTRNEGCSKCRLEPRHTKKGRTKNRQVSGLKASSMPNPDNMQPCDLPNTSCKHFVGSHLEKLLYGIEGSMTTHSAKHPPPEGLIGHAAAHGGSNKAPRASPRPYKRSPLDAPEPPFLLGYAKDL